MKKLAPVYGRYGKIDGVEIHCEEAGDRVATMTQFLRDKEILERGVKVGANLIVIRKGRTGFHLDEANVEVLNKIFGLVGPALGK